MKLSRIQLIVAAALALTGGFSVQAQSNGSPGEADYGQFSRFITDRNIFDPNRYPRNRTSGTKTTRTKTRRTVGAPYVTLVGTMSYEKGMFAFFDSNNSDMKKILTAGDEVASYKVKSVGGNTVTLVGADHKEVVMRVGEQMHQDSGTWLVSDSSDSHTHESSGSQTESTSSNTPPEPAASESDNSTGSTDAPAAATSSNLEANEVLKRLMQLREKENQ